MAQVLLMLLFDIVMYSLLTFYFDHVIPSEFGTALPFYFPLQPSYWKSSGRKLPRATHRLARRCYLLAQVVVPPAWDLLQLQSETYERLQWHISLGDTMTATSADKCWYYLIGFQYNNRS